MTKIEADPACARLNRLLGYVASDPNNLTLRKDAIGEACDTGQWAVAHHLLEAGLQLHANEPGLLMLSALANFHAGHYAQAEAALLAANLQGVDTPELHYNMALVLFTQKRYAQALQSLQQPVVCTSVPQALVLRARCLHHLGRYDEATADCRARLAAAADDAEAGGMLALLLYEQGLLDAARQQAQATLQRDAKQLEALLALASVQADGQDYAAAEQSFRALLETHPDCGRAWLGLALIELSHLQFESARRYCESAAAHMPEHIGTWHVLAWAHIMQTDIPAARAAFETALKLDRNFSETHGGLAVVAALEGAEDEARASIKRASRLDAQSLSMQYAQMLLLQRDGRQEEMRALFEAVLARPAGSGDVLLRDLAAAQVRYLRTYAHGPRADTVYH